MKKVLLLLALIMSIPSKTMALSAWHQKADFGGVARHRGASLAIGNRGYMGLGHYNGSGVNVVLQDWWEFDPSTNAWTQMANYPIPNYAVSFFTLDNKGYIGAGIFGLQFYSYDPLANVWSPIASCPGASSDQICFSVNGKGYHAVGTALYEYDAVLNTWTAQTPMPFSSAGWAGAFTIDDKAYLKSGNQLWEYKSSIDSWTMKAVFPGLATGGSALFSINGNGYVACGGYIGWLSELVTEVWEFNPTLNSWTQLEDFPGMARRFTTGFAIGDKGYLGIGTNGTNFRDFWEFDELLALPKSESVDLIAPPYPNPSVDIMQFTFTDDQTFSSLTIEITDESGRLVYQEVCADAISPLRKDQIGSGHFNYAIRSESNLLKTGKIVFQ